MTGEVAGVAWRWYRGEIPKSRNAQDKHLHPRRRRCGPAASARWSHYIVAGNTDQEMAQKTTDYPVLAARVGANQLEFDPATVSMTISEGDKGRNVGAPVTATGNHGTVRYSLADSGDATVGRYPQVRNRRERPARYQHVVDLDYESDSPATADSRMVHMRRPPLPILQTGHVQSPSRPSTPPARPLLIPRS